MSNPQLHQLAAQIKVLNRIRDQSKSMHKQQSMLLRPTPWSINLTQDLIHGKSKVQPYIAGKSRKKAAKPPKISAAAKRPRCTFCPCTTRAPLCWSLTAGISSWHIFSSQNLHVYAVILSTGRFQPSYCHEQGSETISIWLAVPFSLQSCSTLTHKFWYASVCCQVLVAHLLHTLCHFAVTGSNGSCNSTAQHSTAQHSTAQHSTARAYAQHSVA